MMITWTIIFTNIQYLINVSFNCYCYFSPPADKHVNLSDLLYSQKYWLWWESNLEVGYCKNVGF